MIRSILLWTSIVISTIGLSTLAFITFPFDRNGDIVHHYARWWAKVQLLVSGVRVKVMGLEHLFTTMPDGGRKYNYWSAG